MATGYARLAHEAIPGNELNTPTLSTKVLFPRLQSLDFNTDPSMLIRDDELVNTDEPLAAFVESFDPKWELQMRGYPDAIGMLLTIMLGLPTTTVGNGVIIDPDAVAIPTGAFRHVWTAPFGPAGSSPKTAQIEGAWKDQTFFAKAKGAAIAELTFDTPPSGGMGVKASGPANFLDRIADPGYSPTYEADTIPPFLRANLTIPTWLAGTAQAADFGFVISAPLEAHHTAGSGSKFPDNTFKGDTPIVISGSMPKELIDPDDFDALKAGTTWAAKAKWVSTLIIAGSYPYKFFLEGSAAQYMEGQPESLTNKRRIGSNFGFKLARAGATSSTLTLVNATTNYV
jgi:hypothetical protein